VDEDQRQPLSTSDIMQDRAVDLCGRGSEPGWHRFSVKLNPGRVGDNDIDISDQPTQFARAGNKLLSPFGETKFDLEFQE